MRTICNSTKIKTNNIRYDDNCKNKNRKPTDRQRKGRYVKVEKLQILYTFNHDNK